MGQVIPLHKSVDDRDAFDAQRERWRHERLPDGAIEEDGALFLAVWALIVVLGALAFGIGWWFAG